MTNEQLMQGRDSTVQCRTGQDRTGEDILRQDRTGQDKTGRTLVALFLPPMSFSALYVLSYGASSSSSSSSSELFFVTDKKENTDREEGGTVTQVKEWKRSEMKKGRRWNEN